jgi:formylglycine-generating enzyme required for sulfatase activity
METFVQLAGLLEDTDWLAREVVGVNPWLAWWCVEEGRPVGKETRLLVEGRSIKLLEPSQPVRDQRQAVQALARIKSDRTLQPLLQAAGDEDAEASGLAVQGLVEMGETARALVEESLRGPDRRLLRAALRYLAVQTDDPLCQQIPWDDILGQPLVWVPPGSFLMGSDKQKDSQAYDDELPQHEVTLSGYWIGRYPVTVAQFRAFVKESRYELANKESLTGPDDHPVRWTWREAVAYCRWLSEKKGLPVRLPTEAEWEKAARGTDGRIYPWGNEWDNTRCNNRELGLALGGTRG